MKSGQPRGKTDLVAIRAYNFDSEHEENINGDDLSDLSDAFDDHHSDEVVTSTVPVECISIDDITYDRDLKWINVPNGARPKPVILQGNKFLKQVQTITKSSATDLQALDERYSQMDDRKRNHDKKFLVEFEDDAAGKTRGKRGNPRERRQRPDRSDRAPRGLDAPLPLRIAKSKRQNEAPAGTESGDNSCDEEADPVEDFAAGRNDLTQHDGKQSTHRERGGRGRGREPSEQRSGTVGGRGGRERGGRGRGGDAREVEDGDGMLYSAGPLAQAPSTVYPSRSKADTRKPRQDVIEQEEDATDYLNHASEERGVLPHASAARGGRGPREMYVHPNAGRQPRVPRQNRSQVDAAAAPEPVLDGLHAQYHCAEAEGYDLYELQPPAPPARRGQRQAQPQSQYPGGRGQGQVQGRGQGKGQGQGQGRGQGRGRRAPRTAPPAYGGQEYPAEVPYYADASYYEPYQQYETYEPFEPYEPYAQEYRSAYQDARWEEDGLAASAASEARLNPQAAAFVPTWMKSP